MPRGSNEARGVFRGCEEYNILLFIVHTIYIRVLLRGRSKSTKTMRSWGGCLEEAWSAANLRWLIGILLEISIDLYT